MESIREFHQLSKMGSFMFYHLQSSHSEEKCEGKCSETAKISTLSILIPIFQEILLVLRGMGPSKIEIFQIFSKDLLENLICVLKWVHSCFYHSQLSHSKEKCKGRCCQTAKIPISSILMPIFQKLRFRNNERRSDHDFW